MSGRERQYQAVPVGDPSAFPSRLLGASTRLWRASSRPEPWWFCSAGDCRFDLVRPRGTCYLGTDEMVGLVEAIGPEMSGRTVSAEFVARRSIYGLDTERGYKLADTASRRAIGFGVTNELTTMVPYDVALRWASALDSAGFGGIAYRTRFDTGLAARGVALFGPTGPAPWPVAARREVDASMRVRLAEECGIIVAPPPSLAGLDMGDWAGSPT